MVFATRKVPTIVNKPKLQSKTRIKTVGAPVSNMEYDDIDYNQVQSSCAIADKYENVNGIIEHKDTVRMLNPLASRILATNKEAIRKSILKNAFQRKISTLEPGSVEYRNTVLRYRIDLSGGLGTRDAVVAAASYLSEEENIPYFWGGKYSMVGVNAEWNTQKPIPSSGSDIQFEGVEWPYGLDCSGFVSWAIINGGFKMEVSYTGAYLDYINPDVYIFNTQNLKSGKIKAGDLLYRNGHIAIITELDLENGIIKVAEEKGAEYGMVVTNTTIEEFVKKSNFSDIYSMEDYYNNQDNLLNG